MTARLGERHFTLVLRGLFLGTRDQFRLDNTILGALVPPDSPPEVVVRLESFVRAMSVLCKFALNRIGRRTFRLRQGTIAK